MQRTRLRPRGFTLIEMVIVIVLIGALLAVAIPRLVGATDKTSVRSAKDAISALNAVAKSAAIQRGRTARLVLVSGSGTALVVAAKTTGTGVDTVGKVENLNSRFGVSFTTTQDTISYSPRGIGSNPTGTTIIVSKGTFSDTVTVTAAGRLQQ